ncbi:GntR family transcriptional regulator [Bosea sp. (in: a-proteobacteria)]|uniref:GntR family transcriptional regulator n=1 Tax=Bosea sp. (in: a-proteobacteria) TaxID=1871050 RepID=UPI0034254E67
MRGGLRAVVATTEGKRMPIRNDDTGSENLSRSEFAYTRLMAMIRSGELRGGQRLREVELAEQLGVSRTPVREALRRIGSEGLAQNSPGRGLVVTEYDKQQVRELYALRAVLEGAAAGLATRHASPAEIALMHEILERSVAALEAPGEMMRMNARFHSAIHEAAHNRYLAQALAQMSDALALLPGTTFAAPNRAREAHDEHLAILRALERRAPDEAEALARRHIELAGATRLRMMFGIES